MGRLESTAKAGYFPTPPRVANAIAHHLLPAEKTGKRSVWLLDPCAGTEEAAKIIADRFRAESYGIEINEVLLDLTTGRIETVEQDGLTPGNGSGHEFRGTTRRP